MTAPLSPERVTVHLLELPVPLAASVQEHFDGLLREFALMQSGAASDAEAGHDERHVPRRLTQLVDTLTTQFAGVDDLPRERLEEAIARGDAQMDDHVLELPPEAGPASQALGDLLDEADDYCRRGQHLLTLATPPDCLAYRRWYLSEIIGQLEGRPPVPWPQYAQS